MTRDNSMQTDTPLEAVSFETTQREARWYWLAARDGELLLDPPYQRPSVWTLTQQRNLIRSMIQQLPIPSVVLNDRATTSWANANGTKEYTHAVVDGRQRIETILAWYDGDLSVPASWFPSDHIQSTVDTDDGPYVTYDGLTQTARRFVHRSFKLPAAATTVATVEMEALVFSLINSTGTPQDEATLARARALADRT